MRSFIVSISLFVTFVLPAFGQEHEHAGGETEAAGLKSGPKEESQSRQLYVIEATRAEKAPRIDGSLDDEVWRLAKPVDRFFQQEPREGDAATERTEVRVLYDPGHIYISVHAFDSEPAGVVATEMRRDSQRLLDEDNFQVIIDSFNDSRSGYMFVTSPLGAKLEQQISEEGEGNTRGNNSNINRNWDGVWDAAAQRTSDGWTGEISIPTTTLRFKEQDLQAWGINFMRNIRRKNEQVFWAPIPKAYALTRVSMAGTLVGLSELSQGMDLRIKPFFTTGLRDRQVRGVANAEFLRDGGLDMRYGLTSGLNLDLTFNTDFAQVEVDEQQVNLTRFGLFFPEKREFFLENAGLFNVGTQRQEADLFFSRRIGLSASGQPVPIIGGARVTGKVGRSNLALMDIQTDNAYGKPGENFLISRYSLDILSRSRIGALFINKDARTGSHFNRTMATDATFALGKSLLINGYAAKTATSGLEGRDMSYSSRVGYRNQDWNIYGQYVDIQANFNAEVGFVPRTGIRTTVLHFNPTPRPSKFGVRLMEPMINLTYTTDQHNRLLSRRLHHMVAINLDDGTYINFIYNRYFEQLDEQFRIQRDVVIPRGTYRFGEMVFQLNSNPGGRIYERFQYSPQTFYGGFRKDLDAAVGFRATSKLSTEVQYRRNDVRLKQGEFEVNLGTVRVDYAMSPRMTMRSLVQYNSSTSEFNTSVRFNYIYRPGSDLYVVYNDVRLPNSAEIPRDRQLLIKLSYLLAR